MSPSRFLALAVVLPMLAACQTSSPERVQRSFVDANLDTLGGTGTAAQYRQAEAAERNKAAQATMAAAVPTSHRISHVENDAAARAFGRYTVTLHDVAAEPKATDPASAGLLKQVHLYVAAKKLCETEALVMKRNDDPLPAWDAATREARFRIACVQ